MKHDPTETRNRKANIDTSPEGRRVRLISMGDDPCGIEPGTEGTARLWNNAIPYGSTLSVNWDNGRTLALLEGIDEWEWLP